MNVYSLFFVIYLICSASPLLADNHSSISLDVPPASLEQWYKPANKRQVWLHTMFRLRREMQAISEYAQLNDSASMQKWIIRLENDYNKISEMVPEWKKAIKPELLPELTMFNMQGDGVRIASTLKRIQRSCDDCHVKYQPLVTAMYRSPHYDDVQVKAANSDNIQFDESMEELSSTVNRILIALQDDHKSIALASSKELVSQMKNLGDSCQSCHKNDAYPRERILGKETQHRLETLQLNINNGLVKESQKLMGEIAVTVCARCHNTHRIVSDLRNTLLFKD